MAFLGNDGSVPLVSLRSRQSVGALKMNGTVRTAAFTSDGAELLTSGGHQSSDYAAASPVTVCTAGFTSDEDELLTAGGLQVMMSLLCLPFWCALGCSLQKAELLTSGGHQRFNLCAVPVLQCALRPSFLMGQKCSRQLIVLGGLWSPCVADRALTSCAAWPSLLTGWCSHQTGLTSDWPGLLILT